MNVTREELDQRVAAGAAFLDDHVPNWHNRVDTDTLAVSQTARCVLGQVWPSGYFGFVRRHSPGSQFDIRHGSEVERLGFGIADDDLFTVEGAGIYTELTEAWRRYIVARRCSEYADHFAVLDATKELANA